MLDAKFVIENQNLVKDSLIKRGASIEAVDKLIQLDELRRKNIKEVEELKCRKNEASKEIGELIKKKEDSEKAKNEVRDITEKIKILDDNLRGIESAYYAVLEAMPNITHDTVPFGKSSMDNKIVKEEGEKKDFNFKPKDHVEIGLLNRCFDFERGAKITGSGFPLFIGKGARLERALINFMLDIHTLEHGYTEVSPPFIVNRASMRGTGQIPKLEEDMYAVKDEDFFLIPTAEVPVTNIHAGDILSEAELPIKYTAYTPCFRKEAGSYGKDTKGLIRVHQFDKVELVKFTRPEDSEEELEKLLSDAEAILKKLGLFYRILLLCTGDISFAAHKCYDIELWAPGTGRWLEVSSCSMFSDFQARRANIKYQPKEVGKKPLLVHTLNGSGVALPRLVVAILENYQNEDGTVSIPDALKTYYGSSKL